MGKLHALALVLVASIAAAQPAPSVAQKQQAGSLVKQATAQAKTLQIGLGNKVDDKDVCKPQAAAPPPPPPDTGGPGSAATGTTGGQVTGTGDLAQPAPATAEHHGKGLEYAGLGIGAAGAIGLGVGIYFGMQAKSASDTISNHKIGDPWPSNIKQIEKDGQSDEDKQVTFLIGGGVALAAGV